MEKPISQTIKANKMHSTIGGFDPEYTFYHAKYHAHELSRKRAIDDPAKFAKTLQDAQVDLNPHQLNGALFALSSPFSKGAILADEVGLGKTIEAGMVLSQKWAEGKRRLLVICPANLRRQWSLELEEKFYLPTEIMDRNSFEAYLDNHPNGNPFKQPKRKIIVSSYEFIRNQNRGASANKVKEVEWDMVVIDEAHRLKNAHKNDHQTSRAIRESLSERKKLLLTATPLQNSIIELYSLVSILDEHGFGGKKIFQKRYEQIQYNFDDEKFKELKRRIAPYCHRTLRSQVQEYISFTKRVPVLYEYSLSRDEKVLYNGISHYLGRPKLYALPSSQRALMTMVVRKLLSSSTLAVQGTLQKLIDRLNDLLKQQKRQFNIRKMAEDYTALEEHLEQNDVKADNDERFLSPQEVSEVRNELKDLEFFLEKAKSIKKDAKGENLTSALKEGFEKMKDLKAPRKAVIFTESKRTQLYLYKLLKSDANIGPIVIFNGDNNDKDSMEIYGKWKRKYADTDRITGNKKSDLRQALVDYFRDDAEIMIATEAGAEGINLQFCSLVVNYDLPWNPQRIEQRIGRCHRYGQKYDVVVINFLNKDNDADRRVYQLLDKKFQLFEGVFGSSDEVLGAIEDGINFEKKIAEIYQNCRNESEIKEEFDKIQRQMEQEIQHTMQEARQNLLSNMDEEVVNKLKSSSERGLKLVNQYEKWLWYVTKFFLGNKAEFNYGADTWYFKLNECPFPDLEGEVRRGQRYNLISKPQIGSQRGATQPLHGHVYRLGHPLAQRIVQEARKQPLPVKQLNFYYSEGHGKLSLVKPYIHGSGWLRLSLLELGKQEQEEHLLWGGMTSDGKPLTAETCEQFFSMLAVIGDEYCINDKVERELSKMVYAQQTQIEKDYKLRREINLEQEEEKLDYWAEDHLRMIEDDLQNIKSELNEKKQTARQAGSLKEKLLLKEKAKKIEGQLSQKRKEYFEESAKMMKERDNILSEMESLMKINNHPETLFTLRWTLRP